MKKIFTLKIWQNVGMSCLMLIFVVASANGVARADDGEIGTDDRKILTIYDRGEMKVVGSEASTLGEALKESNVVINPGDVVEPGLEATINVSRHYTVNIYRARPVVVVEGTQRSLVNTAAQDPIRIAEAAGVALRAEDDTSIIRTDDILSNGVGLEMNIVRAKAVSLTLYGKNMTLYTQKNTVADFLREKGISLQKDDSLSVDEKTPLSEGISFEVWRNGLQTTTVEEPINFAVKETKDLNQTVGYQKITKAGQPGIKNVTYEIFMQNGKEVSRKVIQEVEIKAPEDQEVIVGAKPKVLAGNVSAQKAEIMAAAGISPADFTYVDFIITKESGWNAGATNRSSGAYGLCQSLPGSKMATAGADWESNAVTQLRWCNSYAVSRYGGWAGAYNSWLVKHWW